VVVEVQIEELGISLAEMKASSRTSWSLALAILTGSEALAQVSVKLPDGVTLEGQVSAWQPDVSEYLGIPYAQPPVNELRWRAPRAFKGNSSAISAKKFSPTCAANVPILGNINAPGGGVLALLSQRGDKYDEDCLTLNVWTKPQSGEKKKAVMAWIYGGGYGFGNSANPIYNGARLANEHDVVVVGMKYGIL
jgi:carboxylesterase type B